MKSAVLFGILLGGFRSVAGHYFFPHFIANGNFTGYWEYVREDSQGYMPYKGAFESTDLRCNVGSEAFASKTGVYQVRAGDEIGFGTDFNAEIQHPGPLQVYLSKAPGDVREYDGSGDWFKIYELGPTEFSSDGLQWGVTGNGNFTFTLPKETPSGQYLVRIEHIALHGAGEFGGAEFYFNCAQIEVESDSTAVPAPIVKIPGVYSGYEPGILFYMYRPWIVNYTMPGPVPWPVPLNPNITASGVSVAPTVSPWALPAITREANGSSLPSTSIAPTPIDIATTSTASGPVTTVTSGFLSLGTNTLPQPAAFSRQGQEWTATKDVGVRPGKQSMHTVVVTSTVTTCL